LKKYVFLLLLSIVSVDALATVIEFDSPPLGVHGGRVVHSYTEDGVRFTTPHASGFVHYGAQANGKASNDSLGLITAAALRIEMVDHSLFSLGSISLAEYSTVYPRPHSATFTGHFLNGSTVSQTFVTDGLIDSIGGIDDFQTFSFLSSFSDLSYVTMRAHNGVFSGSVAIDDLVVNPETVPEPSSAVLLLIGMMLIFIASANRANIFGRRA
jgi:hypothetical protein